MNIIKPILAIILFLIGAALLWVTAGPIVFIGVFCLGLSHDLEYRHHRPKGGE